MGGALWAPARSLKARAIQLLAQREHSRVELRRKLLAHALAEVAQRRGARSEEGGEVGASDAAGARGLLSGSGGNEADDADEADDASEAAAAGAVTHLDSLLDWLQANQYLCEERFVESRVHARAPRFGNLRIRQELAQHDLSLSADAELALKDTELARARAVWEAKFSGRPSGPADRARQSRFLAGRGFSGEAIRRVLRDADRVAAGSASSSTEPD